MRKLIITAAMIAATPALAGGSWDTGEWIGNCTDRACTMIFQAGEDTTAATLSRRGWEISKPLIVTPKHAIDRVATVPLPQGGYAEIRIQSNDKVGLLIGPIPVDISGEILLDNKIDIDGYGTVYLENLVQNIDFIEEATAE